jgi:hypothetical protein
MYLLLNSGMKNKFQTSFVLDRELWIKFKTKTAREGVSMKETLNRLILNYVNNKESKNASSWFHLPKWR